MSPSVVDSLFQLSGTLLSENIALSHGFSSFNLAGGHDKFGLSLEPYPNVKAPSLFVAPRLCSAQAQAQVTAPTIVGMSI